MISETSSPLMGHESPTNSQEALDQQKLIDLCWKLYFTKDSQVSRSSLTSKYDLDYWLKLPNPLTGQTNIQCLINSLTGCPVNQRETEITRWLNQKLPQKKS